MNVNELNKIFNSLNVFGGKSIPEIHIVGDNGKILEIDYISLMSSISTGDESPKQEFYIYTKEKNQAKPPVHIAPGIPDEMKPFLNGEPAVVPPFMANDPVEVLTTGGSGIYAGHAGIISRKNFDKAKELEEYEEIDSFETHLMEDGMYCVALYSDDNIPENISIALKEDAMSLLPAAIGDMIYVRNTGEYGTVEKYVTDPARNRICAVTVKIKHRPGAYLMHNIALDNIINITSPELTQRYDKRRAEDLAYEKKQDELMDSLLNGKDITPLIREGVKPRQDTKLLDPDGDAVCDPRYP